MDLTTNFTEEFPSMNELPEEVEFIQTIAVDINGMARGKMFPIAKLKDLFQNKEEVVGLIELLGSRCEIPLSITELADDHYTNVHIVPDRSTLIVSPWSKDSSLAMVFYDTYDKITKTPCPFNVRLLAKTKLNDLKEMGMTLLLGVENEFRLFDKLTLKPVTNQVYFMDQFIQSTVMLPYVRELTKDLKKIDIELDTWNLEYGSGQIEIPLKPYSGIEGVDKVWMFRQVSKYVAERQSLIASYMSVPIESETANGMHFNHSLWTQTENGLRNVLWEPDKENMLSDTGKYWLAGILKHTKALSAFFSPTVNCYRRISAGSWAPNKISWNYNDRSVAMRVKASKISEISNYIENRIPSSACNVYIVIAGMIVAGMDGIKNKLELIEPLNNPQCENLPLTLSDALNELKKDKVLVEGMGEKFIDWYIKIKTETDIEVLSSVIPNKCQNLTEMEITKYLHL